MDVNRFPVFTILFLVIRSLLICTSAKSQCATPIKVTAASTYNEDFELNDGGWFSGGSNSDWEWGSPTKPLINSAGGGSNCWVTGSVSANVAYASNENSWIQSPCFDFSSLVHPYVQFKVFWETEVVFDGANLQYSLDNGLTWKVLGSSADATNCLNSNWYNTSGVSYLNIGNSTGKGNLTGWSGSVNSPGGSCGKGNGSGKWVIAQHTMPLLANQAKVIFRFTFGAGSICNGYDGFAVDDFFIGEAPPNQADFTFSCGAGNAINFSSTAINCPNYTWDFGDPNSGTQNSATTSNPSHTFSAPGTYTVTLTASGPDNAPSIVKHTVVIIGAVASVTKPVSCNNLADGSVTATVNGGTGSFTYSWNTNPVQTGATITNLAAGTYTVTVSALNVCPVTASVTLTNPALLSHVVTTTQSDCGLNNGTATIIESGGTAPYQYAWSPSGGSASTANNLAPGNYTITVTDANGCKDIFSTTITSKTPVVVAPINGKTSVCINETAQLSCATTGGSWSSDNNQIISVDNNGNIKGITTGTAKISYTINNGPGCVSSNSVTITVNPLPVLTAIKDTSLCRGANIQLSNAVAGGLWSSSQPSIASINPNNGLVSGNTPGMATISYTVKDASTGCSNTVTNTVTINTNDFLSITANPTGTVNEGSNLTLTVNCQIPFQVISWSPVNLFPGQTAKVNSVTVPDTSFTATVIAKSINGCTDTVSIPVKVNAVPKEIYVPNAFAPDGKNKIHYAYSTDIKTAEMRIFNQWGEMIFYEPSQYYYPSGGKGWNGTYKGKVQPSGVYVYVLKVVLKNGLTVIKKGAINLIR